MSSIIEGYNYDIFISYRQKDNKHDGWVTDFVDNLKGELESTFKEEISVYFDINPHDGLLETHDVDESLKEKLKCLIFIPIISRTYCDPKSFAWEHEFKAFVEMASKDQFGLKVKLPNGNVASRVLPVRIHELETDDLKECELVLGGIMRGVEFIYKEAGIDKPLAADDDEKKNLNKTKYRIQIIKVAHAIRDILLGMKNEPAVFSNLNDGSEGFHLGIHEKDKRIQKKKLYRNVAFVAVILIFIASLAVTYQKIFNRNSLERLRSSGEKISVAVLPFQNLTNDTVCNVWQGVIQETIINKLSENFEDLMVRNSGSVEAILQSDGLNHYSSLTPEMSGRLSQKLNSDLFITGSLIIAGDKIRINALLYGTKKDVVLKAFEQKGNLKKEIFNLVDSLGIQISNFLSLSKFLAKETPTNQSFIANVKSPQAYKFFAEGNKLFDKDFEGSRDCYLDALKIDSNFVAPILMLTWSFREQGVLNESTDLLHESKMWYNKGLRKKSLMSQRQKLDLDLLHANLYGNNLEIINKLRQARNFDDQDPYNYNDMGWNFFLMNQYHESVEEFKKSLSISKKWNVKPAFPSTYAILGASYHRIGQFVKEKKLYDEAVKVFPDEPEIIARQVILAFDKKDSVSANNYKDRFISVSKGRSVPEQTIMRRLGDCYSEANLIEQAEKYYRNALSIQNGDKLCARSLAFFLIDKELNIQEGLTLCEKMLKDYPDDYLFLECKGWGLYKEGKFPDAKNILQKAWELRMTNALYNHEAFLRLETAKKTADGPLDSVSPGHP